MTFPAATPAPTSRTTMRAAVIAAPGQLTFAEVPVPEPGPGEVRVRLRGCGVCGSSLPLWEGREWFTYPTEPGKPGHEGWGVVDKLGGGVTGLDVGDGVALLSYHAFAEYDTAPADAVVKLPEVLADSPFPGEPLGCAMNILERSDIRPGQYVAVIGIGFMGALLTQLAARAGARVIAISRRAFALELAREMGAVETLELDDHYEIIDRVKDLTDGRLCDRVIEAVGLQGPLTLAGELTQERGRLVIAGYHQDGLREVNLQLWGWRGIDVINAHERAQERYLGGMRRAVQAVAAGAFDPSPLYTHSFAFDDLGAAFEAMRTRPTGFLKGLVTL